MKFDELKKNTLDKKDKSKKKGIDTKILSLIKQINKKKDYFTSSSCSGRSRLISFSIPRRKNRIEELFVSHDLIKPRGIERVWKRLNLRIKELRGKKNKKEVWFKEEPMILHIGCSSLERAQELVNKAREIGFRRSGIQATKKRLVVEIGSDEGLETIVMRKGNLLINKDYLREIIRAGNKKLKENWQRMKRLEKAISKND